MLVNAAGPVSPGAIGSAINEVIHGKPPAPVAFALDHPLSDYVGTFRGIGRGDSLTIVATDSAGLRFRLGNGQRAAVTYVGHDTFMIGRNRFAFVRTNGAVTAIKADMISVVSFLHKL